MPAANAKITRQQMLAKKAAKLTISSCDRGTADWNTRH
jgi:hypothetical protein